MAVKNRKRLTFSEVFGLSPLKERVKDLWKVFFGDPHVPSSKFGLSSTKILKPHISFPTWQGLKRKDGRTPVYNFYNRNFTSLSGGYSVKVTDCRDWRGGQLTYDSHRGTDFALPVGTPIVAAARGKVLLENNNFDHGGLKLFLDHGEGMMTGYSHLSRTLVEVDQIVERGEVIALSGASGIEFLLCFPWVAPHLHFNVFLNGTLVDPFPLPASDEKSLWIHGTMPRPRGSNEKGESFEPTDWDRGRIGQAIQLCRSEKLKEKLESLKDPAHKGAEILFQANFYPARFTSLPSLYPKPHPRRPRLTLPLRKEDFRGIYYPGCYEK